MAMVKFLQTITVIYKDLCSKDLTNDLKEAASCEVRTVCRLACDRCPYAFKNIDAEKINIKGLHAPVIKLEKVENEQLLISITALNIESWLQKNNLSFTTRKVLTRGKKKPSIIKRPSVNRSRPWGCLIDEKSCLGTAVV
jgi:uncharacterized Fe-S cluster-containing protein